MDRFPLWIAQDKYRIIAYDAQFNKLHEEEYSKSNEIKMRYLISKLNESKDISLLHSL